MTENILTHDISLEDIPPKKSQLKETWHRFKKNKLGLYGLIVICVLIVLCACAPLVASYEECITMNVRYKLLTPSLEHPFGTDGYGRDLFARCLHGGRVSLLIGLSTSLLSLLAGGLLGLLAGCTSADKKSDNGNADNELGLGEAGKLVMSTNAEFPPYEMKDDSGKFIGIDVEIAQAIAAKLGLELVIDDMSFDAALMAVQQGKSDMVMAGVTVNEDRLAVMDFSDSYATGIQVVIVKEGSDVTMDNLGDMMIGTQMGTTGYIYASDTPENGGYGEDHVIAFETDAAAVEALKNGQIDCIVIDNAPAAEHVAANPGLTILEGEWVEEEYAIGLPKGNTQLKEAINKALAELKADGTLDAIVAKYIKAN